MRWVCLAAALALASGCGEPPAVSGPGGIEDSDPRDIQLPLAIGARVRRPSGEPVLYLNVTKGGYIALPLAEVRAGQIRQLVPDEDTLAYFQQRVKEDLSAEGKPRSVVLLRIDARARFQKTHAIICAARQAGYRAFRLGVLHPDLTVEAEFELCGAEGHENGSLRSAVVVSANDAGNVTGLVFRGPPGAGRDHGTDLVALLETLTDAAKAARPGSGTGTAVLTIEVDPRLIYGQLVPVIDVGTRAGFCAVSLTLIPPKAP